MRKVNVGIVGCGMITQSRHAPEYRDNPHAHIAGFFDSDPERASGLAEAYGGRVYQSPEELFADPKIEAVSICSPNYTHAGFSVQALEAGKHVLCEKPMALSLTDTRRMMEAAEKSGKFLMVGHNQRLLPTHRTARELLRTGMIGTPLSIQSHFKHPGPEYWSVNRSSSTWFFEKAKAQFGVLGDLGAHKLDIIRFLTGDEVDRICCESATMDKRYPSGELIELEDNAAAIFYLKSGLFGSMNVSWTNYGEEDNSTIVYGDKGVMKIFGDFADDIVVELRDGTRVKYQVGGISTNTNQLRSGIIDEFLDAILQNREPAVTGRDGHRTLAVILAGTQSAAEHRWVKVAY